MCKMCKMYRTIAFSNIISLRPMCTMCKMYRTIAFSKLTMCKMYRTIAFSKLTMCKMYRTIVHYQILYHCVICLKCIVPLCITKSYQILPNLTKTTDTNVTYIAMTQGLLKNNTINIIYTPLIPKKAYAYIRILHT